MSCTCFCIRGTWKQGLRCAAQKEPAARLSFILQELVSMRQRVSATPTRAPGDTGFLKITTVNCKGKFVRILNTSLDQDVDLSGFIIQQWIGGYPVSIYRFPPDTMLPALHHVTTLSRYTAPHRLTAAADAYTDNTDLSVDKFPLAGEGEEAEEPLPQKDEHWVPAAPRRGSTGRPPAVLQKASYKAGGCITLAKTSVRF
ncbi:copine-9 [Platysternon megacephalum]|uniref:Copine-9 n=1 Tax=Platysternon megacephalum TaxID=55544 RepID=A0A4D9DTF8_9SAUR|nr:copine-9 [Platysternon megacephalum]